MSGISSSFSSPVKSSPIKDPTTFISPKKLFEWPVEVLPSGTIDPSPPEKVWSEMEEQGVIGNTIYRYKHGGSNRRYYGSVLETEQNTTKKRFSAYKSKMNSKGKKTHIEYAVCRSPKKFSVAIVQYAEGSSEKELHVLEEKWIRKVVTHKRKNGYNHSFPTTERLRSRSSSTYAYKGKKPRFEFPPRPPSTRVSAIKAQRVIRRINFEELGKG